MNETLKLVRPNPYDVQQLAVHPAGADKGSIILCKNQTAIWVNQILSTENDGDAIQQITQLSVRLMDLEHLHLESLKILPTVMEARKQMRILLKAERVLTHPDEVGETEMINAEIDGRLAAFGTMIESIKASSFTAMKQINEISDKLEVLGVRKVDLGDVARETHNPDKVLHRKRAELATHIHHAHLEWASGMDAQVVAEATGFPVQWIVSPYSPSERELDEMLDMAA